ncbi:hypothetical protein BC941DRAFT_416195 [Chlamydoabsidia padenii]|nr:hypothetical protein BC941DRAFT_416195 [Chlamydoabsidia padenii]
MGQTPSTTARHDNASTRTLHSSSIDSTRPLSFFRRISRRLNTHPNRRFGRQRGPAPSSSHHHNSNSNTSDNFTTSIEPSTTSSVRRATVAATHAAAAATSPIPPLPFLHIDPHPSNSSAASTTSAISNSSEISQILDIISSAVLSSLPLGETVNGDHTNTSNGNNNTTNNTPYFRYVPVPIRHQQTDREQRQRQQSPTSSIVDGQQQQQQQQTVLPIFIVGYHPSTAVDSPPSILSTHSPAPTPSSPILPQLSTGSYLRRPHSAISTSSSLATLQSMPLSIQSNRTNYTSHTQQQQQHHHHHHQQQQQREILRSSSSSSTRSNTSSSTTSGGGHWVIYVMGGGSPVHPALARLSDNPTYEDLLWLSNLMGPARPVTTTQQVIDDTLPILSWSDETTKRSMLQDTERCLVCLDDFIPKQSVRVLKCRHVFHVECVDRWLVEAHNSCPICRLVPCTPTTH